MVLGRLDDTRQFIGEEGYNVLNLRKGWSIDVNDGWMLRDIRESRTFELASKPSFSTLRQAPEYVDGRVLRDTTVFFRELKMLRKAGYVKKNLPDGRTIMLPGGIN